MSESSEHSILTNFYTSTRLIINSDDSDIIKNDIEESLDESIYSFLAPQVKSYETEHYFLNVRVDGLFLLKLNKIDEEFPRDATKFEKTIERWTYYLNHINCFCLILDSFILKSGLPTVQSDSGSVKRNDVDVIQLHNNKFSVAVGKNLNESVLKRQAFYSKMGKDAKTISSIEYAESVLHYMNIYPREINSSIIDETNLVFNYICNNYLMVQKFSQILKAIEEYKNGNFNISFILLWFMIEQI